jgi:hypothetical protein
MVVIGGRLMVMISRVVVSWLCSMQENAPDLSHEAYDLAGHQPPTLCIHSIPIIAPAKSTSILPMEDHVVGGTSSYGSMIYPPPNDKAAMSDEKNDWWDHVKAEVV